MKRYVIKQKAFPEKTLEARFYAEGNDEQQACTIEHQYRQAGVVRETIIKETKEFVPEIQHYLITVRWRGTHIDILRGCQNEGHRIWYWCLENLNTYDLPQKVTEIYLSEIEALQLKFAIPMEYHYLEEIQ